MIKTFCDFTVDPDRVIVVSSRGENLTVTVELPSGENAMISCSEMAAESLIEYFKPDDVQAVEPAPVESMGDWVKITDIDHVLRAGVDYVAGGCHVSMSHGETLRQAGYSYCHCLRRDLPVKPTHRDVELKLCVSAMFPINSPIRTYSVADGCPEVYLPVAFDGTRLTVRVPVKE